MVSAKETDKAGERLCFGGTRFASAIFPVFTAFYLMGFLTDVVLLSPAVTAVILFSLRIFSAVDDQFIGLFFNRKNFKNGKYRPYLKWCALPFAVSFALLGLAPEIGFTGKIVYISIMLALSELFSSVLSTAELSMLPYLAKDDVERTKLMSFSNAGSILAYIAIGTFMMPLVNFFGQGDKHTGFALTLVLLAILSVPIHFWGYFGLKEKQAGTVSGLASIRDMFSAMIKNRRFMLLLTGYCVYSMADVFKSQMTYYYMTYNMGRQDLLPVIIMAGLLSPLAVQPLIPRLLKFAGKETLSFIGLFAASGASVLMLAAGTRLLPLFGCIVLYGVFTAIFANLVFIILASFSDQMLEQKNMRMSDILTVTLALSSSIGAAFASSIAPLVLEFSGYSAQTDIQLPGALSGIKILYILCTAAAMALAGVFMLVFRCKKTKA